MWYENGVPVVAPVGEFDLATVNELSNWLVSAAEHGHVIVELQDTEFLDLAALERSRRSAPVAQLSASSSW